MSRGNEASTACAPWFEPAEFAARLDSVRRAMARTGIDLMLVSSPENIFWLTGLDHWGYFAPHVLVVPLAGEPVLVTRAMEAATIAAQVRTARFEGHADTETAADGIVRALEGRPPGRIGIEAWSSGLPHGLARDLAAQVPATAWIDATSLVDDLRACKSPAEQAYMRAAARLSDAGAEAAIAAVAERAAERDIAAECQRAMTRAGGTFPGFGPFIRSTRRLGEEHTSWTDAKVGTGDAVFLEISGCMARYHAPLGRLVHVGRAAPGAVEMAAVTEDAFAAALHTLRDGVPFREVYAAWQGVVDRAGLPHYRRHHCGYMIGIGFPPTWTGSPGVSGLRPDSDRIAREGMSFHVLSWLMGTGRGDYFISDTVLLGPNGPEVLTRTPTTVTVR